MNNTFRVLILAAMAVALPSHAISVGEITSIINSDQTSVAKEVGNTTDAARFVSVTVKQLSSPLPGGQELNADVSQMLLSTPTSLILPGQTKDVFRFFYKGPADDKERYYRLQWTDEPVTEHAETNASKAAIATASARIGTILVVAPRKARFDYQRNNAQVENTGNVSFRVVAYGPCKVAAQDSGRGCRERYYVMPGSKITLKKTDISRSGARIGIWYGQQFINVK